MPTPIAPVLLLTEGRPAPSERAPRTEAPPDAPVSRSFAELLEGAARHLDAGRRRVDAVVAGAQRGDVAPEQLLAIQAGVYRYTQEVELASKVVDKATNALKTVLQSQQ
jgi:hypothetical protein